MAENFIFSNVAAKYMRNKSFGFQEVTAVSITEFFREKIVRENKTVLVIHAESLQLPEQIEMLKQYPFNLFSKIILADSCISHAIEKFQFIPSRKLLILALNENRITIGKKIKTLLQEIKNNELSEIKELGKLLGTLRGLTYSEKFNDRQMALINLLPFNFKNETMAKELHLSLPQCNRLLAETADVAGVVHSKHALYKYVIDKGILMPDQEDEEIMF